MDWIAVKHLPPEQDLTELSRFLRQRGLPHRITDERDGQQLWVQDPALVEPLSDLVDRWLAGEVRLEVAEPRAGRSSGGALSAAQVQQWPVTFALLVFSALGAGVGMRIFGTQWLPLLTFQPLAWTPTGPEFGDWLSAMGRGELWRLLTPAFLHFGALHLVFNGMWLWFFGLRIEGVLGSRHYLLFFLGTAIAANFAQYSTGPSVFGGMSGVVYALIGYIWMRQKYDPHPALAVPPGIIGFMLLWLILCLTGVVDAFMASGGVANGAHVGGLLAGMAWAILGSYRRRA